MVKVFYDFETKQDFIDYLGLLIEHLQKYLMRYKYYRTEIEEICLEKYKEIKPEAEGISVDLILELLKEENYSEERKRFKLFPYYKYIKLSDMLNFINLKILNIIGDRTQEAVSYMKFRDKVKAFNKKTCSDLIELDELTQDINEKLNKCNKSRNYLAHIGDSVFIAQMEYRNKQLKDFEKNLGLDFSKSLKNKIIVNRYDYADVEWIFNLFIEYKRALPIYLSIFQQIRRDYTKLIGETVTIETFTDRILPFDYADISMNSIDMQLTARKRN
ncbi:hypothetical protein [Metabacillus fastidiosus]|uniref:hypothetical protein n=1 Tax=Metabacillus fastidiosus TaxID=1458 RepID=UPI0008269C55|nr:hypothetical protein [Metabacillus fastidiosus]MED4461872.1 hypothetical protein [Metabacillus fastidiosus]